MGLALPLGFAAYLGLAALVAGRLPRLLPRASLRSAGAAAIAVVQIDSWLTLLLS